MTEFYEFHDSDLVQIEHRAQKLVLKMDAYKHIWPDGYDVNSGTGWMQEIEITIDEPVVDVEPASLPMQIDSGSLKANNLQANLEDILGNSFEIPASLSGSDDVQIDLKGYDKTTSEPVAVRIRGKSAAITHKGEARFVEKLPWWNRKDNAGPKPKMIGVGMFDSGIPDLATNKKYMEGFGEWKK
jgi:hypothetical protein